MIRTGIVLSLFMLVIGTKTALADEQVSDRHPQKAMVRLMEYRFEPSNLTFTVGRGVELTLINEGTVLHEFVTQALRSLTVDVEINGAVTEALGVAEIEVPPNGRVVLRFTPKKTEQFSFACKAAKPKNHFNQGMVGLLSLVNPPER